MHTLLWIISAISCVEQQAQESSGSLAGYYLLLSIFPCLYMLFEAVSLLELWKTWICKIWYLDFLFKLPFY